MLLRTLCALIAFSQPLFAVEVSYIGSWRWTSDDPLHGGFSALELSEDGAAFVALSDRGLVSTGTLQRDEEGVVNGVSSDVFERLKDFEKLKLRRYYNDPEGLAIGEGGTLFISFEAMHRVWSYAAPVARPQALPLHPDFAGFQNNSGLEALAIDPQGRLLAVPERSGDMAKPFPVFRFEAGHWSVPYTMPRNGEFLPVGMDIGPDGKLYLLERWFRGIGFSSRVRRFDLSETGLSNEVILLQTGLGAHDNLEGIAVWQDEDGIRLTMLSDDNFKAFQKTEFVDYRVTE